jgi:hypothetical protein
MTPEQAAELRKAFPAGTVGKLPKGGVMLDYVGHAAVTDRLLKVDPDWTWEPFSLDEHGLPAVDRAGNLWIKLTICGVTRIGVGDGKSAKEAIGDAIRNAAMRFGVALDLWSKEELESSHVPTVQELRSLVWERSKQKDSKLSDDDRKAWIAGELQALGGDRDNPDTLHKLLKEWA